VDGHDLADHSPGLAQLVPGQVEDDQRLVLGEGGFEGLEVLVAEVALVEGQLLEGLGGGERLLQLQHVPDSQGQTFELQGLDGP
jgi:hypothetical protein